MSHKRFSANALKKLSRYDYPGNIRELKSIVEQSALLANEDLIDIEDLPDHIFNDLDGTPNVPSDILPLDEVEKLYLQKLFETKDLPVGELAKKLDVSARTLYRKLQKHMIKLD